MAFYRARYGFLETAEESQALVRRFDLTPRPPPREHRQCFPRCGGVRGGGDWTVRSELRRWRWPHQPVPLTPASPRESGGERRSEAGSRSEALSQWPQLSSLSFDRVPCPPDSGHRPMASSALASHHHSSVPFEFTPWGIRPRFGGVSAAPRAVREMSRRRWITCSSWS